MSFTVAPGYTARFAKAVHSISLADTQEHLSKEHYWHGSTDVDNQSAWYKWLPTIKNFKTMAKDECEPPGGLQRLFCFIHSEEKCENERKRPIEIFKIITKHTFHVNNSDTRRL